MAATNFTFQAKDPKGKIVSGTVKANSDMEVKARLRAGGYSPLKVVAEGQGKEKKTSSLFTPGVSSKDIQIFFRQLSVLLRSGVPLVDSLQSLSDSTANKTLSKVLNDVLENIEQGKTLNEAMKLHPKVFDKMVVNLAKAGEMAGVLETVFDRVAVYYEKRNHLKAKVVGALTYPVVTLLVSLGAVAIILTFVIPKFQKLFGSKDKLPALTQKVINLSDFFVANYYIIFPAIIAVPILLSFYYKTSSGQRVMDRLFLKIPVFGSLIRRSAIARMSRTMATLLKAGVRLNEAIEVTLGTTGNVIIEDQLEHAKESILSGKAFSIPLRESGHFPKIVTQMVVIGEKTGNIDEMLESVADFYEDEVGRTAEALTSLMEPFIIVLLGGMVGTLVIAMFLPVFNMANAFI